MGDAQPVRPDPAVAAVAEMISRELDEDFVGLWKIAWHLRHVFADASWQEIRDSATEILWRLRESGMVLGHLSEETGEFVPWVPAPGIDEVVREWSVLARDPNLGEVAWLVRR